MAASEGRAARVWPWFTAWSLQGSTLLLVDALDIEGTVLRFAASGVLAGLPLIGLYLFLRSRETA